MSQARNTVASRADSDGYVRLRLTPVGGENVRIRKFDRDTSPDFTLEIAFNTLGLSITMTA